jgi:hypothetical protein
VPSASTSRGIGPSTSSGTRATARRGERGTSGTSWQTGYARGGSPTTGVGRGPPPGPRGLRDGAAPGQRDLKGDIFIVLRTRVIRARRRVWRRAAPVPTNASSTQLTIGIARSPLPSAAAASRRARNCAQR